MASTKNKSWKSKPSKRQKTSHPNDSNTHPQTVSTSANPLLQMRFSFTPHPVSSLAALITLRNEATRLIDPDGAHKYRLTTGDNQYPVDFSISRVVEVLCPSHSESVQRCPRRQLLSGQNRHAAIAKYLCSGVYDQNQMKSDKSFQRILNYLQTAPV